MKLNPRILMLGLTTTLIATHGDIHAQTVISGPNILTSTWSPAGSPYIVTADCTVPAGQTLTILPGTTVWMGSGTSLTGVGVISAVGTAVQRITFQPPILSQMWNTMVVRNASGTNQLKYCDFISATNALDFLGGTRNELVACTFSNVVTGVTFRDNSVNTISFCNFEKVDRGAWLSVPEFNLSQDTRIVNCVFTNCSTGAIYGQAAASWGYQAYVNCTVINCLFADVSTGCRFDLWGNYNGARYIGQGHGDIKILNSYFHNVTNTAVVLDAGGYAAGGPAALVNNIIANTSNGIVVVAPWDAKIQNNILTSCATAVTRAGSLSATVSYNDFFANGSNFIGYPVTYGQVILANRNGTPCDVLFNIFTDPMLVSSSDFHLQAGSPCIDAGEGSGANFDSYFPPSMGSLTNDIGAYGGPGAGQWNVPPPTNAFTLAIAKIPYVSVTVNPPEAGNYRLEYASALLGTNTWIQITNLPLTTLPFTYTEPATVPARYYRAVKQ